MRSYLSLRRPFSSVLASSLLALALLVAPAAFAGDHGKKDKPGGGHSIGHGRGHVDHGFSWGHKKKKHHGHHHPPVVTAPPEVPELAGSQTVAAATLLCGAFLLLAARRRSTPS